MNYQWHYNKLIETRKSLNRSKIDGNYYELHHIVLKSMGGSNNKENLILLTAREHFVAHWLLWRIHRNRQTAFAFFAFGHFFKGKNHKNRKVILSSRGYSEAREAFNIENSKLMTGKTIRARIVLQYDLENNFIEEWPSAKIAQEALTVCHVTACCRGERPWAGGFIWKYKDPYVIKSKPYKKREQKEKTEKKELTVENRKRISIAVSGRTWYNNGEKSFFLKPFSQNQQLSSCSS